MNLSEPFIRRPVMTTLIMAAILFLGIFCYRHLSISNLPDVTYPTIQVVAALPGASPETMANTVASPLEKEFMAIPGITEVTSTNKLGSTEIVLEFEINKSMDSAAQDVEAAISRAQPNLPPNLPNIPTYEKVNPSDTPIIYIALTSPTMSLGDLYTYAYTFIGQRISMLEGVAKVITYGSPFAVRVQVDPGALASRNVTLTEVAHAVSNANPDLPTGRLDGQIWSANIVTYGQLQKGKEYQPVVITYRNKAPVRIGDVGRAIDSVQNDRQVLRYVDQHINQPTVVLAVQRFPGANTVQVAEAINAYLPQLLAQLPASVDMKVVFDRSESIKESIADVKFTLFMAFVLVVTVIFLYLGKLTDTVIPSLALPMSIVATFIVMYLLNFTIDNLSLLALMLAIGFIVDDAIVVLENIVRHVEKGETPWYAALEGSKQISFTILSMTLSLAAVFIPMLFMPGLIGKIFQEFSITLVVVTLASGVISLTLTPMLCSRFIPPRDDAHRESFFGRFAARMNTDLLNLYQPALKWVLNHRWVALTVGIASVVFSALLFRILPTDFIPDDDIGFIIAFTQAEQGTSSERMAKYSEDVTKVIQQSPNVASLIAISGYPDIRDGLNFVRLKPRKQRKASAQEVIQQLYPATLAIPGVNVYFKNIPLIDLSIGAVSKGSYQYALQGPSAAPLYDAAEKLIKKMQEDPTFQGVSSDLEIRTPQLNVNILRDQAYTYGVNAFDVENALLLAYSGNRISRIQTPINQYDVILELEKKYQRHPETLSSIYVRSVDSNKLVPLSAVAEWNESVGPASINHISQFPAVTLSFSVAPGIPLSTALAKLKQMAEDVLITPIHGSVKGAAETFEESIRNSAYLLLFAVIAIYIVLGILYESFIHPLTILSTLPPATLGALITLKLFGYPLSLYAYLGLILLIGIVKKNGIMMVDYALHNIRVKRESPVNAIYDACIVRFRPIMMTTLAAIFGAIPIVLGSGAGSDARRPLGLVIIGGLLFSQLITLFVTPVIYLYLEKYEEKVAIPEGE